MRKLFFLGILALVVTAIAGCGGIKYNIPSGSPIGSERKIAVEKSKDEVWDTLLAGLADRFFSINNIEKDSGFINVSFFSNNPCSYVDCGTYKTMNKPVSICDCDTNESGNFSSGGWTFQSCSTKVEGRINILVQEITPYKTSLFVDIRFVVYHTANTRNGWDGSTMYKRHDVVFDSNTTGRDGGITCISLGKLEGEVMNIINIVLMGLLAL